MSHERAKFTQHQTLEAQTPSCNWQDTENIIRMMAVQKYVPKALLRCPKLQTLSAIPT